ncbi:MAG TPA: hypothetical protein VFN03_07960, partial [Trueperaceae bacterium]|nr:hypothetical protein [Trueperaceae bacterium]
MWLPRVVEVVAGAERPVVLVGGEAFGVPFVIDALQDGQHVAWFTLDALGQDDEIAQGNVLARAVNAALPAPLLTYALPFRSHVAALRRYRSDLRPLTFAVTLGSLEGAFVDGLLDLHGDGYTVVLDSRASVTVPAEVAKRSVVVGPERLRLTLAEAMDLAPGSLPAQVIESLWREADGRFTDFTSSVHMAVRLPRLTVPSPAGPLVEARNASLVEPRTAVLLLQREGDLAGALELAVLKAPEMVEELLRHAGPRLQEEGLLQRLHLLLTALPEAFSQTERVLEWRLVAGTWANDFSAVFHDVDAYLETYTAPALRARRAGTLSYQSGFELAEQAVTARRTALTVWQHGRM